MVDKTTDDISCIVRESKLSDIDSRLVNLIISLLTGSINDISKISKESFEIEQTLLESVKIELCCLILIKQGLFIKRMRIKI